MKKSEKDVQLLAIYILYPSNFIFPEIGC